MKKWLIGFILLGLILSVSLSVFTPISSHYGFAEADGNHYRYSPYFVASRNSNVYHYPDCYHVRAINEENLIYFNTPEDAIESGRRPCQHCNPPEHSYQMEHSDQTQEASTIKSRYIQKEELDTSKFGESGIAHVIDGDTIDVEGIGRVRFADINCPEWNARGGEGATDVTKRLCEGKKIYLDIDDIHVIGGYGRIIAVVYAPYKGGYVNLNQLLLRGGYAKANDYPNEFNPDVWVKNPLEVVKIKEV